MSDSLLRPGSQHLLIHHPITLFPFSLVLDYDCDNLLQSYNGNEQELKNDFHQRSEGQVMIKSIEKGSVCIDGEVTPLYGWLLSQGNEWMGMRMKGIAFDRVDGHDCLTVANAMIPYLSMDVTNKWIKFKGALSGTSIPMIKAADPTHVPSTVPKKLIPFFETHVQAAQNWSRRSRPSLEHSPQATPSSAPTPLLIAPLSITNRTETKSPATPTSPSATSPSTSDENTDDNNHDDPDENIVPADNDDNDDNDDDDNKVSLHLCNAYNIIRSY
jgi:hypothetical protein